MEKTIIIIGSDIILFTLMIWWNINFDKWKQNLPAEQGYRSATISHFHLAYKSLSPCEHIAFFKSSKCPC